MSHAKVASLNLLSTGRLFAAAVLLSLLVISQAAPLRQQRGVVSGIPLGTQPPTNSEAPDCMEVNNKRVALHGTPDKVKDLYANLTKTYQNSGNLTFDDVKLVYEPKCKTGSHETDRFEEIQCFNAEHSDWPAELPKQFCWCADPITGHPINDTIKEGPINKFECTLPESCRVEDKEFPHGTTYEVEGNCQTCTCLNGATTCQKILSSDERENITTDALYILKVQVLKLMYVQLHSGLEMEAVTDQRAIEAKNETLPWMCRKIGKSYLGHLHSRPLIKFANTQVAQFTCSYNLVKYFARILDNNEDRKVDQTEFIDFFNLTKNDVYVQRLSCLSFDSASGASGVDPSC